LSEERNDGIMKRHAKESGPKRGIFCGVLLLLCLVAVGTMAYRRLQPRWKLTKAFINLGNELESYENPVLTELSLGEIGQLMASGATHTVTELNVTLPEKENSILGVTWDKSTDRERRLMTADGVLGVFGAKLRLKVAADEKYLQVTLPDILNDSFQVDMEKAVDGFNSSWLSKLIGWEIPEDYLEIIFGQVTEGTGPETATEADTASVTASIRDMLTKALAVGGIQIFLPEERKENVRYFLENVEMSVTGDAITIQKQNREIVCDRYEITVGAKLAEQLLLHVGEMMNGNTMSEEILDILHCRVMEDVVAKVYLDSSDRIVCLTARGTFAEQSKDDDDEAAMVAENGLMLELVLDLMGEERTVDLVNGTLNMSKTGEGQVLQEAIVCFDFQGLAQEQGCESRLFVHWKPVQGNLKESEEWMEEKEWQLVSQWDYRNSAFMIDASQTKAGKSMSFDIQGEIRNIVPGKSFQLNVDSMLVKRQERELCKITGSFFAEPLTVEIDGKMVDKD